jgi:asparagine synthase (glutamine-hydrolysing)
MSMAHGLEVRVPFCDHLLVEFMARLPASEKMPRLRTKALLRDAVRDLLPPTVRRRKKLGFNPPLGIWLNGPLRPMLEDILSESRLTRRGLFNPAAVRALMEEHRSGRRDRSLHLWALLNFEVWAEQGRV